MKEQRVPEELVNFQINITNFINQLKQIQYKIEDEVLRYLVDKVIHYGDSLIHLISDCIDRIKFGNISENDYETIKMNYNSIRRLLNLYLKFPSIFKIAYKILILIKKLTEF